MCDHKWDGSSSEAVASARQLSNFGSRFPPFTRLLPPLIFSKILIFVVRLGCLENMLRSAARVAFRSRRSLPRGSASCLLERTPMYASPQQIRCESSSTAAETREFQAETKQLLDIVIHSLYTDKEVFLRELVSNASDALEKLRHLQVANQIKTDDQVPLEIRIELDEVTSTITISDSGVGMTKDEMIENLGTIAKSGSKNFKDELAKLAEDGDTVDPSKGIIGRFGVGFYSAFMVGDKVEVRSRSAKQPDEPAMVWTSDGLGSYDITNVPEDVRQDRGTSVVIHLREEHWNFVDEPKIEKILQRYSNFINFPIYLNGNRLNTVEAIWDKDPKTVEEEEYSEFYKYVANAVDEPLDTYHFRADAPLDVKALFFVPSFHSEKYGMGRMDPGVSLYSRKVLIESKSPDILPDWLRFIKGVVDSEDLPLSVSREKAQDSALIAKLRRVLTRKFIAHLTQMAKKERSKYVEEFYNEYAFFLKEGVCQDYEFQSQLSKLLYYETSKQETKDLVSLDDYIGRMRPEQKEIYYIVAPNKSAALSSPYMEAFKKANVEVILLYTAIDDFVMANLEQYEGRKLVSVEKGDIDLKDLIKEEDDPEDTASETVKELSTQESVDFCNWFRLEVGEDKVGSCTVTNRLSNSPAIVTDNESGAMRRMMRLVDTSDGGRDSIPLPKQHVEINPKHPVIVGISELRQKEPTLAKVLADQVYDNCLVAAGLLDDSRTMLPRLNDILLCVVNGAQTQGSTTPEATADVKPIASDTEKSSVSSASKEDKQP